MCNNIALCNTFHCLTHLHTFQFIRWMYSIFLYNRTRADNDSFCWKGCMSIFLTYFPHTGGHCSIQDKPESPKALFNYEYLESGILQKGETHWQKWFFISNIIDNLLALNNMHLPIKYDMCPSFSSWDKVVTASLPFTQNDRWLCLFNKVQLHNPYICPSFPFWAIMSTIF